MSDPAPGGPADRFLLRAAAGFAALGATAVAAIFVLVFAAVVVRYLFAAPFRFTEELGGLLLSATVFLTLPFTIAAHRNIRVTILSDRAGPRLRRLVWIAGQGVLIAFAAIFAWEAWKITEFTLLLNLKTDVSRVPLAPFMIALTVSVVLAGLIGAWQALRPQPGPGSGSGSE